MWSQTVFFRRSQPVKRKGEAGFDRGKWPVMQALQSLSQPVREPIIVSLSELQWMSFFTTQLLDTGCPGKDVTLSK